MYGKNVGGKMLDLIESHNFKEKCLWKIEEIKLNNPVILNQLEKEILRKKYCCTDAVRFYVDGKYKGN